MSKEDDLNYISGFKDGLEAAARHAKEWGDVCAGGSGEEIIPSGPSKGQRYGEGYYNLATSIRKIRVKV